MERPDYLYPKPPCPRQRQVSVFDECGATRAGAARPGSGVCAVPVCLCVPRGGRGGAWARGAWARAAVRPLRVRGSVGAPLRAPPMLYTQQGHSTSI